MLTPTELAQLDATLLPALERHHLRLLAHALRTLQAITAQAGQGPGQAPSDEAIARWARTQEAVADDDAFVRAFTLQLQGAAVQLQAIAMPRGVAPLALTLNDLSDWAIGQADQRLKAPTANPPPN
ncbi:MAG: hypothetical protein VKO00_04835 [Cyanobacteriota bacterium]|jgi:hypothetical protein|nr:hypothetical protein [Cyanobacteriota bacterium]